MKLDPAKIDDAVAALLYLNATFERLGPYETVRSWKSLDWDALDRLHAAGLISDPRTKTKSVTLTEQGVLRSKAACERLFRRT
ncbi:MAG: hypothetical protein HZB38_18885 [Planctomycetes bacterium]|nr:hypothetical protein [Planctomycetota bacterium]